jgi:succinyl-diaminopimelate desuccinylase
MSLFTHIESHKEELLRQLRSLVRLPTVNPPGKHYDAITRLLVEELRNAGLRARRFTIPAAELRRRLPRDQWDHPRFNVLGTLRSRGASRTIHFNAHYDVVPVSGRWRGGDPFGGDVRGGWIYGRGTADMKGSIASLLLALRAIRRTGACPRVNIEVSFTADEETDSALGAGWLVREAPIDPDFAIVMEGGQDDAICCGHNGVVWLEVSVHGRAAHGSRPERGVNALEKMAALIGELGAYRHSLDRGGFKSPDGTRIRPTLNLGGVFGQGPGGKINTVPNLATFSIDRRVHPGEDHAAAEKGLRVALARAAARIPGCRISVRKVSENFSCYTPPRDPFFAAMADSVARVRRRQPRFSVTTGFTDMHFFARHLRIPTLGYGPGGQNEHAIDERASFGDLVRAAKIYADLLTTFEG